MMVEKTVYTAERFIADVRQVFASSKDPRSQAQAVARHMKELLAVPGWIEEKADLSAREAMAGLTFMWMKSTGTLALASWQ